MKSSAGPARTVPTARPLPSGFRHARRDANVFVSALRKEKRNEGAAGQIIDHHSRRLILNCCYLVELSVSLGLLVLASFADHPVRLVFALLFVNGIARTFETPTLQSIVASTVPRRALMQAVSAHASAGSSQLAGPALGGLLYGFGPGVVFGLCAGLICIAGISSAMLPMPPTPTQRPEITFETVAAGIRFIWNEPAVLGAMSLDLVATLFGGVVALLPIFAGQILHINVWGFGLLSSHPQPGRGHRRHARLAPSNHAQSRADNVHGCRGLRGRYHRIRLVRPPLAVARAATGNWSGRYAQHRRASVADSIRNP